MKLLVTGINGFVGSHLSKLLTSTGHDVIALVRHKQVPPHKRIRTVMADLMNPAALTKISKQFGPVDRIIHLAAGVPKTNDEDTEQLYWDNIAITASLLDAFGHTCTGIIFISTVEVYGNVPKDTILSGTTPAIPSSRYAKSKLESERLCLQFGKKHHIPVSVLRLTVLYGIGDTISRAIPNFIQNAVTRESPVVYGGSELRDYLHADEAARAILLAASVNAEGIFVIGSGKKTSVKQAAQTIVTMVDPTLTLDIQNRKKPAYNLIINTKPATKILGFTARYQFPARLKEQILWSQKKI